MKFLPQEALNALYQATQLANFPKAEHDKLLELAKIVMSGLETKSDEDISKKPNKKK